MAVPSVFVSSVIRGFEEERAAAALAIERMGMHAVLSERLAADPAAPRRALFDEVAKADVYLLLLGHRYGDESDEKSPTEEEFEEAERRHRPALVLVMEGDLEPRQREFLARVRGTWGDGVLSGSFTGSGDIGAAVAAALARLQAGVVEDGPAAQERAVELARGPEHRGSLGSGLTARVAYAPLRQTTLLDAVALDDASLGDALAGDLRSAGVVPQNIGIDATTSAAGVRLRGTEADRWTEPEALINADGSIVVTGSVASDGMLGSSLVDPERLEQLLAAAGRFAQLTWNRVDHQDEISRVAAAVGIPDAEHKGFGGKSDSSMTVSMRMPPTVVAPVPAHIASRLQLTEDSLVRRLVAEIKRVFADAGAVQQ